MDMKSIRLESMKAMVENYIQIFFKTILYFWPFKAIFRICGLLLNCGFQILINNSAILTDKN